MLVPRLFNDDFFDVFPFFNDAPRQDGERKLIAPKTAGLMKTDIKETDKGYSCIIDLPGFNKEDIEIELKDKYLIISATKNEEEENNDGKYIRKERYIGTCSRSFFVGDTVNREDIDASFKEGILRIEIPKKEKAQIEEKKLIEVK